MAASRCCSGGAALPVRTPEDRLPPPTRGALWDDDSAADACGRQSQLVASLAPSALHQPESGFPAELQSCLLPPSTCRTGVVDGLHAHMCVCTPACTVCKFLSTKKKTRSGCGFRGERSRCAHAAYLDILAALPSACGPGGTPPCAQRKRLTKVQYSTALVLWYCARGVPAQDARARLRAPTHKMRAQACWKTEVAQRAFNQPHRSTLKLGSEEVQGFRVGGWCTQLSVCLVL